MTDYATKERQAWLRSFWIKEWRSKAYKEALMVTAVGAYFGLLMGISI